MDSSLFRQILLQFCFTIELSHLQTMLKAFFTFVIFLMLTASRSFNVHQEVFAATKTHTMVRTVQTRIDQVYGWLYGIVQEYRGDPLCFRLLGIHPGSSTKQIRSAFRKRSLQAHPDKVYGTLAKIRAEEHFKALNQAREDAIAYAAPVQDDSAQKSEYATWCLVRVLTIAIFLSGFRRTVSTASASVKNQTRKKRMRSFPSENVSRGSSVFVGIAATSSSLDSTTKTSLRAWSFRLSPKLFGACFDRNLTLHLHYSM